MHCVDGVNKSTITYRFLLGSSMCLFDLGKLLLVCLLVRLLRPRRLAAGSRGVGGSRWSRNVGHFVASAECARQKLAGKQRQSWKRRGVVAVTAMSRERRGLYPRALKDARSCDVAGRTISPPGRELGGSFSRSLSWRTTSMCTWARFRLSTQHHFNKSPPCRAAGSRFCC